MDKRISFTGGEPDVRLDQILIDAEANRPAMHAMMKSFAVGNDPNFIISGCVVTVGGASPTNTWSLAAGYIYLNDEILEVESDSGTFDSATEFLAFDKVTTYDSKGDKNFIDGTPRQTWQVNRGEITVQGSISSAELDAINGEHINNKISRYITGGVETASGTNITIANDTKYLIFNANGPSAWTITVPDPDDDFVFNETIIIDVRYTQGTITNIQQADTTVLVSSFSTNAFIILVNDGTATWEVLTNLQAATSTQALAMTNNSVYLTPLGAASITGGIITEVYELGDWDMDTTGSIDIAHGLTYTDIISARATIRNDADSLRSDLENGWQGGYEGNVRITSTNISLYRIVSGVYDHTDYDSTSYNRGWLIVQYLI